MILRDATGLQSINAYQFVSTNFSTSNPSESYSYMPPVYTSVNDTPYARWNAPTLNSLTSEPASQTVVDRFLQTFSPNVCSSENVIGLRLNKSLYIANKYAFNLVEKKINDLPVYSFYPKEIYTSFDQKIFIDNEYLDYTLPTQVLRSRSITLNKDYLRINKKLSVHTLHATMVWDLIDWDNQTLVNNSMKVVNYKSFCTGSNYELSLKSLTKKALSKASGCLVPVCVKTKVFNFAVNREEDCYFFTFAFNASFKKLHKYKKAKQYLADTLKYLTTHHGSYFYDKDYYNRQLYQPMRLLSKYIPEDHLQRYQNYIGSEISTPQYQALTQLDKLTKKFHYPPELLNKKERAESIIEQTEQALVMIKDSLSDYKSNKDLLYNYKVKIRELTRSLLEYESKIDSLTSGIREINITNKFSKAAENINKFNKFTLYKSEVLQKLKQCESLETISEDATLKNLLKNIDLIDLTISYKETPDVKVSFEDIDISDLLHKDYSIKYIEYATKKPSIIKVNGKTDNNMRVAGPFHIKHESSSMYIKPVSLASYFGHTGTKHLKPHPHASAMGMPSSSENQEFGWASACLGEAQSIIYHAMQSGDLTKLFISDNIWLTSANSADPWGKSYTSFTKYTDYQTYMQYLESLTEEAEETKKSYTTSIDFAFQTNLHVEQDSSLESQPPEEQEDHIYVPLSSINNI